MIGRKTGAAQAVGALVSILAARRLATSNREQVARLHEPPDTMWPEHEDEDSPLTVGYGEPTCRACQLGGMACHNHREER